jgi:hypothetical protein
MRQAGEVTYAGTYDKKSNFKPNLCHDAKTTLLFPHSLFQMRTSRTATKGEWRANLSSNAKKRSPWIKDGLNAIAMDVDG